MSEGTRKYTPGQVLYPPGNSKVTALAISPDGRDVVACHDTGDEAITRVTAWRLSSATATFTMTTPYKFTSAMWPLHGVGATFLGLPGVLMVFPPCEPGYVKVAIIKPELEVVIVADFREAAGVTSSGPGTYDHLLAVASPRCIKILAVSSDGVNYEDYQQFSHVADTLPVAIAWGAPTQDTPYPVWTAYRNGSVVMHEASTGQAITRWEADSQISITWASFSRGQLATLDEAGCLSVKNTTGPSNPANVVCRNATWANFIHDGQALLHGTADSCVLVSECTTAAPGVGFSESVSGCVYASSHTNLADPPTLCMATVVHGRSTIKIWRLRALAGKHSGLQRVPTWAGAFFALLAGLVLALWLRAEPRSIQPAPEVFVGKHEGEVVDMPH